MTTYSDTDVQVGLSMRRPDCEHEQMWAEHGVLEVCQEHSLRAALDAVVPSIVARAKAEALREAARDLSRDRQEFRDWKDPRAAVRWVEIGLHARADEIEAGR